MSVQTLKGLDLVQELEQPIPTSVINYYKNTYATGTGPYGVLTIADFFGLAQGTSAPDQMNQVNAALAAMSLSTLQSAYDNMLSTVQGTFGPVAGPITIPSGPGAGVYTDGDDAFVNGLIPAAESIISGLISTYPVQTSALNTNFNLICQQISTEAANQAKTGLKYNDITGGDTSSIMSFVSSLAQVGSFDTPGGASEYIINISDTSNQTGQAIVGAIREGKNKISLNEAGIPVESFSVSASYPGDSSSTGVPVVTTPTPSVQPPTTPAVPAYQPTNNPSSTSYTVQEAQVVAGVVPPPVTPAPIVKVLGIYTQTSGAPGTLTTTLLQGQSFYIKVKVSPSSASTLGNISSTVGSVAIRYTNYSNSSDGIYISAPGWLIPTVGVETLIISANEVGGPVGADSATIGVAVNNAPRSTEVVQDGWFESINTVKSGSKVTVTIKGSPGTQITWNQSFDSTWPQGIVTLDGSGVYAAANLPAPPVGTYQIKVQYSTGSPVYTSFTVVPA
jgi:hypothetical protein